ncbi:DUF4252 domain-containing protein [Rubrivirga sp. IMCC45206]|uniref:DUF4252 domain-containing protein n=1 Tax=Rubrivirga sp. IMCC45206 TaxID=3391614 RepID=UPI00398FD967
MRPLILAALAAFALPLSAQPISGADLDALFGSEPQVEINLQGSLLRLAAAAARTDEPEAALMLDGLRRVTVRVYPAAEAERSLAVTHFADVGRRFEADGWLTLVRVRSLPGTSVEDDGDVWVYVRDAGDVFDGMAVLAVDPDDNNAVFVLIDGTIDPTQVGALSQRFGRVDIDSDWGSDDEDDDDQ